MFNTLLAHEKASARIAGHRARLRFVNGLHLLLRDPSRSVGRTPFDVVMQQGKVAVRRYRGATARHRGVPVLLLPPLMVKPFIFDLYPQRSLVQHLLNAGFAVYLVDFGEPERGDADITLDHYVVDWIPAACGAVRSDAKAEELSLVGYCMGGLFALCHTAANEDLGVRNIVTIASPVDTHKMGLFAWVARLGGRQIEQMARRIGNVPGPVSSMAFRMVVPAKNFTRYADLLMNMWDREYVRGFDAMNQWTAQFIDYPRDAFVQFMRDFMRKNKLVRGKMRFRDRLADLKRIRSSLLAFAGATDQIVPVPAVRASLRAVGSKDKAVVVAPGGHMGVFAGATAPEHVWTPAVEWLIARSDR